MKKNILLTVPLFSLLLITLKTYAHDFSGHENEAYNIVKVGSKSVVLQGTQQEVGSIAPNFKVANEHFSPVSLNDFKGKKVLLSIVPSLDTGVCSVQTKLFNEEAIKLEPGVKILTISTDLPFAQKRFCNDEKVSNLQVLSDAVWHEFGYHYGLHIKDMGLLARAIFVINESGIITYKEIVGNLSQHPNYEVALQHLAPITPNTQENLK